jgi:DNA repair exonuclease SbcCD nuclease subunit
MPRFLHTADWQIGRQYGQFPPEDAIPLAEARFKAVERIAALANEHRVDAVLVAGDVFDTQTVSPRTIRQLFNAMAGFRGQWIMIAGNHDAALAESVWTRARRLEAIPANVDLLLEPATVKEYPALGMAILAAPLTQRHTYDDLTAPFDEVETTPGLLRIGLAHGSVQGMLSTDIDSANPIAPDRAEGARLDYLALGDWHGCLEVNARVWYSGTPEPERFRNNDAGRTLLVDIPQPGSTPQVTRLATGQYRWESAEFPLNVPSDVDPVIQWLSQQEDQVVLNLVLSGQTDIEHHFALTRAISEAEGRLRSVRVDLSSVKLIPTDAEIAGLKADGYLGEVIADLRDLQNNEADAEIAGEALAILATLLTEQAQVASA